MSTQTIVLIVIADLIVVSLVLAKLFGRISEPKAKELLFGRAKLLDVRSPGEFASGHLAGAVNVPYQEVAQRIAAIAPDKSAPLLVYCLSGGRSGIAKRILRRHGYTQAHNLGSLSRAKRIIES